VAEAFPDPRDNHGRLVRCETMLENQGREITQQGEQIGEMDKKLDGVVEYVNTRRGAFRLAERLGLFIITLVAAVLGTLLSWWHQK
jgi:hypothetical protein